MNLLDLSATQITKLPLERVTQQRYQIPFQFCGSRTEAERFAQSYFHQQFKAHLAKLLEVQRTLAADGQELSL